MTKFKANCAICGKEGVYKVSAPHTREDLTMTSAATSIGPIPCCREHANAVWRNLKMIKSGKVPVRAYQKSAKRK